MTEGIVGEFFSLKQTTDADLLAMQCGDFYEFFGEDAETVADELDLKISEKASHGSSYPMAGVPVDDLTPYLKALVERGYRVAVADQYETDAGHAREVVRTVSPGTVLDPDTGDARYLAAVVRGDIVGETGYGLAFAEVTTGEFVVTTAAELDEARADLFRFDPEEVLPGPEARSDDPLLEVIQEGTNARLTLYQETAFAPGRAKRTVDDQFGEGAVRALELDSDAVVAAAGAVLTYVEDTGAGVLASMTRLRAADPSDRVRLDTTTQRNLELTETMHGESDGSLLETIDHTRTAAGARLLREWLTRPHRDREELTRRLDAIEALVTASLARDRLRETLSGAPDLERLVARATSGTANADALLAVRDGLRLLPALASDLEGTRLERSAVADVLAGPDHEGARGLHDELDAALADDSMAPSRTDGRIARGYDEELDTILDRYENAVDWLETLEARIKRRCGLQHVTVDRNKTDGYYIQIGKSEADAVPDEFREIKTLKNSKRFVTDELEEKEREVLRLEEARSELEQELLAEVRETVAAHGELVQSVGRTVAELDTLAALADHAAVNDWVRPELTADRTIDIEAGRHPVVEQQTDFVPNDLRMTDEGGFQVVTGPNMSGKSTYMRQCALIVLLGVVGSFVPADVARIPLVDGIFTRVGALDELAGGRSTFMVEMQELSRILHSATDESLVILDEVGRGTATYDGVAIAWATTEYIHNELGSRTLFATHYHELTALADRLPGVHNVHMAAEERDDDVTFLWTVRNGPGDRSYGVHVADLAGVPAPVVDRARDVLERLRDEEAIDVRGGDGDERHRQVVFDLGTGEYRKTTSADGGDSGVRDSGAESVLEELRSIDVNETPPVELMARVQEWQSRLPESSD